MYIIEKQLKNVHTKDDMIKLLANWYYTNSRVINGKQQAASETKLITDKADELMAKEGADDER